MAHRCSCRFILPCLLALSPVFGGELKVDINRDSKNYDSVTQAGYDKWSQDTSGGAATGTNPVSKSFTTSTGETVTITFAQTAASAAAGGAGLLSNWYQAGAQGNARLVSDGLTVDPANFSAGGQIQMTITGLSAGDHTLLTYHNAWDNLTAGSLGPIDIYVNGSLVVDNLQPTIRAATNIEAANAYLHFTASGPSDTATILFAAETSAGGSVTIRNAMINGFEIDTPNIYRIASNPYPADGDEHVDADSGSVSLSWTAALDGNTVSHDVYFGTDFDTVKNADTNSTAFLTNQTATACTVTVGDPFATYYWRIDEMNTVGEVTPGTVWSFRPRHLAFPGAEGYGRFARGGRGGRVVHVTSLTDYASTNTPIPGTLRYAIEEETGPRVIVFDVGGLITLSERLTLSDDDVTVAGQTAPGKGLCLRQYALGLSGANDAIVRFIRNRPGNISGETIDGGGLAGCDHSIMDHCSISWSIDEGFSGRNAKNITLQRTLISEALNIAGHQNYPPGTEHGYAATISGDIGSYHHNLLAHCEGRNWSLGGGLDANGEFAGLLDIRNNVVYNWGSRTTDGGAHEVNFVANYYKPGAASTIFTALNAQYDNFPGTQQYYMVDNVMPGYFDESDQADGRTVSGYVPTNYPVWVSSPFFDSHVATQTALGAYKRVLSDVGDNRPLDDHDARVVQETLTGTYTYTGTGPYGGSPGLPNSQDDVGGWEDYPVETRAADWDTDQDGLPNWWEQIHGTSTNSPPEDFSDANADPDGDGYSRLDDYLAWMALPRLETTEDVAVEIDLAQLTAGYTSSPVHQVSDSLNGFVQILADGHTARFIPSAGFAGLAQFNYSVTDADTDSMSGTVGVLVLPAPAAPDIVERIYALTTENQLISFDSIDPGTILTAYTVSGLQPNEKIVGIDFWNDTLYGLGDMNHLYTLNLANGAAGLVGSFTPIMNGQAFGFEAEPGGLRLVSDLDQNLLLDYNTGAATVGTTINGSPNPALTGLAYHPNSLRYVADYAQNTIGVLNPNSGLVSTIGPAGVDFSRHNGFDISSNPGNTAYLASPAASSGLAANLYTVDLATGSATLAGLIGLVGDNNLIRGLAVEPGYVELTATGLDMSVDGSQLSLSWPPQHTGWHLQCQTNPIDIGLTSNWLIVGGSEATNQMSFPISKDQGSVFYRLVYP